jgi:hypothetical protein
MQDADRFVATKAGWYQVSSTMFGFHGPRVTEIWYLHLDDDGAVTDATLEDFRLDGGTDGRRSGCPAA